MWWRKYDNIFSRFDRVPACDRRTDRRTDWQTDVKPIAITCFSIADARKKVKVCYLYSASSEMLHFWIVQHWSHSFLHCKYTMPPLPRSSPEGATTERKPLQRRHKIYFVHLHVICCQHNTHNLLWPFSKLSAQSAIISLKLYSTTASLMLLLMLNQEYLSTIKALKA